MFLTVQIPRVLTLLLVIGSAVAFGVTTAAAQPSPAATTAPKGTPKQSLFDMDSSFSKEPTFIKSDSLTLKSAERYFVYDNNVEVKQGDLTVTCNLLEGTYDEANQIKQLIAKNNVLVTKGDKIRATGDRATYDKPTETIVLTENPELQQEGSVLTADRIRIFLKEDRSVAEGQVRVKMKREAKDGGPSLSDLTKK